MGANFNQNLAQMDFGELRSASASWIRGFYPLPDADQGGVADQPVMRKLRAAYLRGYRTIFTLKFPLNDAPMPAPDSPEFTVWLARLDRVLLVVMGQVDILEIGNEPFIESRREDRDMRLNLFYEAVARHVIDYRSRRGVQPGDRVRTRLYMGALNRLDLSANLTPAVERWMTFVRQTPQIDGVDIHPHVPDANRIPAFVDYILPRMRPEQTFLCTEFSLVWRWQQHLTDPISPDFGSRYGFAAGTQVWQVIGAAIKNPFPQAQWDAFLASSSWFVPDFLADQVRRFRATQRLAVATYGFRQDSAMITNWGPSKPPWLLNSVFDPYTIQPDRRGQSGVTSDWLREFRALQG